MLTRRFFSAAGKGFGPIYWFGHEWDHYISYLFYRSTRTPSDYIWLPARSARA
jgi:hypothetical protein